jgi:hypothetical protein
MSRQFLLCANTLSAAAACDLWWWPYNYWTYCKDNRVSPVIHSPTRIIHNGISFSLRVFCKLSVSLCNSNFEDLC